MLRKLVFVGMILVLMVSFSVVLADQDGNAHWCNSDQYGCWITNEEGGQDYIMFWSESAREYFMGPGSNAVIADPVSGGKMDLQGPSAREILNQKLYNWYVKNEKMWRESVGLEWDEQSYMKGFMEYIDKLPEEEVEAWLKAEKEYYYENK